MLTGEKIPIKGNPRVKVLLSSMGRLSVELMAAIVRSSGINTEAMPIPDINTLQLARNHASGKECVPSHLVLGSALKYFHPINIAKTKSIFCLFPSPQDLAGQVNMLSSLKIFLKTCDWKMLLYFL